MKCVQVCHKPFTPRKNIYRKRGVVELPRGKDPRGRQKKRMIALRRLSSLLTGIPRTQNAQTPSALPERRAPFVTSRLRERVFQSRVRASCGFLVNSDDEV